MSIKSTFNEYVKRAFASRKGALQPLERGDRHGRWNDWCLLRRGSGSGASQTKIRRRPRKGRVRTVLEPKPLAVWAYNTHLACSSDHTALHNDAQLRPSSAIVRRCASLGGPLQSYAQLVSIPTQWRTARKHQRKMRAWVVFGSSRSFLWCERK